MTEQAAGEERDRTRIEEYRLLEQVGYHLRLANQRYVGIFTSMIGDRLTTTQWAALIKLYEVQPCSQNKLGREIALDVATIKGVVDRLVLRGYVRAEPDETDGRRRVLSVTPEGVAAIRRNLGPAFAITEKALEPLTPAEQMMLYELLQKIS
ncbi:MarR family winged helix-turn-helix transcriptional regulator [Ensifer soli]|uniref:MarR family winged helix-turn-helix transcriptional regulator n=1 Tax=Ciceribacter sp. sgz301302 TaxID=3342379 RepID=UPI0035BB8D8C